jgi:hypothetical protein
MYAYAWARADTSSVQASTSEFSVYSRHWSGIHRENSNSFSPKSEVAEGIGSIKVVSMYYMYYIFFLFIECLLTNYCIYVQYMPSRIVFCVIRENNKAFCKMPPIFTPLLLDFSEKTLVLGRTNTKLIQTIQTQISQNVNFSELYNSPNTNNTNNTKQHFLLKIQIYKN